MSRPSTIWPAAVATLLAGGVAFDLIFFVVASRDPSFSVERDYYRKAIEWDRTMIQQVRNAELGWAAAAALESVPGAPGQRRLAVTVVDRAGTAVGRATVTAELFHSARAGQVMEVALAEGPTGRYAAPVAASRPGLWEVRLTVRRGDATFTRTLEAELGRAP